MSLKGRVLTEEHKLKISRNGKGLKRSKETKAKMKESALNRPKEHNEKISKALTGVAKSEEHIKSQRKSRLKSGQWHPIGYTYIHKGYRYIKISHGQGQNFKAEHRLVMEQTLGRPLNRSEHVHHLDGNPLNNSPDNLIVLSAGNHYFITQLLKISDIRTLKALMLSILGRFPDILNHDENDGISECVPT